jgi:hypothetical protein
MSSLMYEEIGPVSRAEAESVFASGDACIIARTLIAIGLHDIDWAWVQEQGLQFLSDKREVVVSAAILAIAHTARVNGAIDITLVVPALRAVAADTRYVGKVQDALDDIEWFVKQKG